MLVAVQEWYQTDTYNLYQSDPRGVLYSLVLEDVRSSRQAEEGVMVDVLEVGPGPACPSSPRLLSNPRSRVLQIFLKGPERGGPPGPEDAV